MSGLDRLCPFHRPLLFGSIALLAAAAAAMPPFGSWSEPFSIESLPGSSKSLNTAAIDGCASLSHDGLTIAFNSNRTGDQDIYVAVRGSTAEGFADPVRLPAPVNSAGNEFCPTLRQGNRLYFSSTRHDPAGDLYLSRSGPKGWSEPQRFGSNINEDGMMEESAAFYEDPQGREVMLFSRRPPSGIGGKIYQSVDGGAATLVAGGPHSSAADNRPSVTHDGKTIFFDSTRAGSQGPDIWYATRSNSNSSWGAAIHLPHLSSPGFDARPFVSWDGSLMTFSSNRAGSESPAPDIWMTSRDKAVGK